MSKPVERKLGTARIIDHGWAKPDDPIYSRGLTISAGRSTPPPDEPAVSAATIDALKRTQASTPELQAKQHKLLDLLAKELNPNRSK